MMKFINKMFPVKQAHIDILSDQYPLPVLELSSHGSIIQANAAALELYGLSREAVMNGNYFELGFKYGFPPAIKSVESVLQKNDQFFFVGATNTKGIKGKIARTTRWFALKFDKNSFYLLGIDTTDLVQESETLKEMNRVLIDNIPNYYIFWKDKDSRFLGCNITFAKAAGYRSPDELIGKTDHDMPWTQEESDAYVADDRHVMESGIPKLDIEERQTRADGSVSILSTTKVPVRDKDANVCGLIGIFSDITDKKNKEKQLLRTKEQLENALKSRNEFVRNIRHDIRTPLTGISEIGRQLSLGKLSPEEVKEFGQDIQDATEELMELLNQIIEMSKVSSSEMEDKTNKFEFSMLISSIMKIYKLPALQRKLTLTYIHDDKIPRFLLGKNLRLHKILLNLVGNAIKFTEQGFVELSVTLAKQVDRDVILKIDVKDSGIGVPDNMLEAIFEPLVRLNPSYEGTYKGSGMGLNYVKEHIKKMNGEVYVESTVGKGSTFTCIIPLQTPLLENADDQAVANIYPTKPNLQSTFKSKPATVCSLPLLSAEGTVLLVEDHLLAQKTTKNTLNEFGYNVDIASNGVEAVSMAKQKTYDIIFMDIGLPDISGIEATKHIRNDQGSLNKETLVIALTAHADDEIKNQALSAGMQRVFNKPLTPDKVGMSQLNIKHKMEPNQLPVIDWPLWLSRAHGNEALANEMFTMLVQEFSETKELIEEAIKKHDFPALMRTTHKMKGGLCYCGLPALEQRILMLHEAAKEQDIENVKNLYQAVFDAIQQVEEVYEQRLN